MTSHQPLESTDLSTRRLERCVLFADVCDSSRLYRELGDESARAIVSGALDLAREAIEAARGRVVDTIGDEVFCVLPAANEGLAAAIEIHERLSSARACGTLPPGVGFRVGLAHGPVGLDEERVFGDTVYLAKRISSQAKYEQILLSEETRAELLGADPERFRLVGTLRLKGRVAEIELVEALWGPDLTMEVTGLPPTTRAAQERELVLTIAGEEFVISRETPFATLGRGDSCHVVVSDARVSRLHARVELLQDEFVWMDQSRNGSVILIGTRPPRTALRSQAPLEASGRILLGPDEDAPVVEFEVRERGSTG